MKRHWEEQELAERWSLTHDEFELVRNRTNRGRIGFAALLKFFQLEGRFPTERREVPRVVLEYLASQLEVFVRLSTSTSSQVEAGNVTAHRFVNVLGSVKRPSTTGVN